MPRAIDPTRLDVLRFAQAGASALGEWPLRALERLAADAATDPGERTVAWQAEGELRAGPAGAAQAWLHVRAQGHLPQVCQRCLEPVDVALDVDRWFRFVVDEATALAEDDGSEEDLLVLERAFDLRTLVEDELLLALPPIPRHDRCPVPVRDRVADPGFDEGATTTRRPFEALAAIKSGRVAKGG